jgi:hypothetical protein
VTFLSHLEEQVQVWTKWWRAHEAFPQWHFGHLEGEAPASVITPTMVKHAAKSFPVGISHAEGWRPHLVASVSMPLLHLLAKFLLLIEKWARPTCFAVCSHSITWQV